MPRLARSPRGGFVVDLKSWLQRTGATALLVPVVLAAGCHRPVETPIEARRFCIGLLLDYGDILDALQRHSGDDTTEGERVRRLATYAYTDAFVRLAPAEQRQRAAEMEFGVRKAIDGELSPDEQRRLEAEFERIKQQSTETVCPRID
jgi:hypothetical protein